MRLLQMTDETGRRRVSRVGDDNATLDLLVGYGSILELARDAIRRGCRLDDLVRVNTVVPGWVLTERQIKLWLDADGERQLFENQCLKEKLYPPDIARMVLWLAADDSRLCTAQNFIVDAGWT